MKKIILMFIVFISCISINTISEAKKNNPIVSNKVPEYFGVYAKYKNGELIKLEEKAPYQTYWRTDQSNMMGLARLPKTTYFYKKSIVNIDFSKLDSIIVYGEEILKYPNLVYYVPADHFYGSFFENSGPGEKNGNTFISSNFQCNGNYKLLQPNMYQVKFNCDNFKDNKINKMPIGIYALYYKQTMYTFGPIEKKNSEPKIINLPILEKDPNFKKFHGNKKEAQRIYNDVNYSICKSSPKCEISHLSIENNWGLIFYYDSVVGNLMSGYNSVIKYNSTTKKWDFIYIGQIVSGGPINSNDVSQNSGMSLEQADSLIKLFREEQISKEIKKSQIRKTEVNREKNIINNSDKKQISSNSEIKKKENIKKDLNPYLLPENKLNKVNTIPNIDKSTKENIKKASNSRKIDIELLLKPTITSASISTGLVLGINYHINDFFRIHGEINYFLGNNFSSFTFPLSLRYSPFTKGIFEPFIGIGAFITSVKQDIYYGPIIELGNNFNINDKWSIPLAFDFGSASTFKYNTLGIKSGIKYLF